MPRLSNFTATGTGTNYNPWSDWFANGTATTSGTATRYTFDAGPLPTTDRVPPPRPPTRSKLANDRAEALFKELLTPEQLSDFGRLGRVDLVGSEGRSYRINCNRNYVGNIHLLNEAGRSVGRFCCHGRERDENGLLPVFDQYITQLLFLRADENLFIRTANVHAGEAAYQLQDELIREYRNRLQDDLVPDRQEQRTEEIVAA